MNRSGRPPFSIRAPGRGAVFLLYAAAGLLLMAFYRFQINPDGMAYISIARKYLAGDFAHAVNGYWGPLTSWLLVPFLAVHLPPLLAGKILGWIVGFFTLHAVYKLGRTLGLTPSNASFGMAVLTPFVLYFAYMDLSPDLLLTAILLFYLSIVLRDRPAFGPRMGAICGGLGALAYLAKQYGLVFFLGHFLVSSAVWFITTRSPARNRVVIQGLIALLIVGGLGGAWASLLSAKYGKITLGTSGTYNFALRGIETNQPQRISGFIVPPNPTAFSAWEDPSFFSVEPWNPFATAADARQFRKLLTKNVVILLEVLSTFSLLAAAILLGVLLSGCGRDGPLPLLTAWMALFTMAFYCAGYLPVFVFLRYLAPVGLLLGLLGVALLQAALAAPFFTPWRRAVLLTVFALSFAIYPLDKLAGRVLTGKSFHDMAQTLKNECGVRGATASANCYHESLYLAFHIGGAYYGKAKPDWTSGELLSKLESLPIDYYIVWDDAPEALRIPAGRFPEVTGGRIPGLQVYALRQDRFGKPGPD